MELFEQLQFCNFDTSITAYYDWPDFVAVGKILENSFIKGGSGGVLGQVRESLPRS
jgi:hypothetical protein